MKYRKILVALLLFVSVRTYAQVAIFCSHKKFEPAISVTVSNCTSRPLKLWREYCSWGWANFSVEFDSGTNRFLVKRKLIDWPLNAPAFYSLPPKGTNTVILLLEPVYWKFPAGFSITNDFSTRILYAVSKSRESQLLGVLTGEFSSNWESVKGATGPAVSFGAERAAHDFWFWIEILTVGTVVVLSLIVCVIMLCKKREPGELAK